MKTSKSFIFHNNQPEYIIQLKPNYFPWWILFIPLLSLLLFIPIEQVMVFQVIEKKSKKNIEKAHVILKYSDKNNSQTKSYSGESDSDGKISFEIGIRRLYQVIIGQQEVDDKNLYIASASKENYLADSVLNKTLSEFLAIDELRLLKLVAIKEVEKHDSIPQKPREGCRAFFTGLVVGGEFVENDISEVYKVDKYSEYVGEGDYPDNEKAFPNAVKYTFDGIAIDKGTRIIIYSKKNFEGEILLDKTGPAIINNVLWENDSRYTHCNTDIFKEPLQSNFPQSVREWSKTNTQDWSFGSLKVICNK